MAHVPSLDRPFALPASLKRGSKFYDLLTGTPLILCYVIVGWKRFHLLGEALSAWDFRHPSYDAAIGILSNASILFVALLFIVFVTFRSPPIARARGLMARIAAVAGTYLSVVLFVIVPSAASEKVMAVSTVVILLGTLFAAYSILHLGRSVSLVPEARKLVTSGPYRFVRHPLYLGEEVAVFGSILQHFSAVSLFVLAVQIGFQFYRMSREEDVLASAFPEYESYAKRTWRILPGVY